MRLRQRTEFTTGLIAGTAYDKRLKRTTANYSYKLENAGTDQAVYDTFPHQKHSDVRNLAVPPLNPVSMSKICIHKPPKQNVVSYLAEDATARYSLKGENLAACLCGRSYSDPFKPPYAVQFITVDGKVASYLYQRALAKASSAQFDFGVTVGEIAETASFLAGPLTKLVSLSAVAFRGIQAIRTHGSSVVVRMNMKASKKHIRRIMESSVEHPINSSLRVLDESANHWLAYKFGVLPILDDIAKAQKFREENVQRQLGVQSVRIKGYKSDTTTSLLTKDSVWYHFGFDAFRVKRVEDQHHFGLYFRNRITAPLATFMEQLGFAPWSPFTLAYELIPLSFVVDRFIDIKSFVRGNLGGLSKHFLGYYCSRKLSTTYSGSIHNLKFGYPVKIACKATSALNCQATVQQITRTVNVDRPLFPVINPYWEQQLVSDATNLSLIWGRLRTFVGK